MRPESRDAHEARFFPGSRFDYCLDCMRSSDAAPPRSTVTSGIFGDDEPSNLGTGWVGGVGSCSARARPLRGALPALSRLLTPLSFERTNPCRAPPWGAADRLDRVGDAGLFRRCPPASKDLGADRHLPGGLRMALAAPPCRCRYGGDEFGLGSNGSRSTLLVLALIFRALERALPPPRAATRKFFGRSGRLTTGSITCDNGPRTVVRSGRKTSWSRRWGSARSSGTKNQRKHEQVEREPFEPQPELRSPPGIGQRHGGAPKAMAQTARKMPVSPRSFDAGGNAEQSSITTRSRRSAAPHGGARRVVRSRTGR